MKMSGTQNLCILSPLMETNSTPDFVVGLLVILLSLQYIRIDVSSVMYCAFSLTSIMFLTFNDTFTFLKKMKIHDLKDGINYEYNIMSVIHKTEIFQTLPLKILSIFLFSTRPCNRSFLIDFRTLTCKSAS